MERNNELNEQLLKRMFNAIRSAEIQNIKTKKYDDKGMVRIIEKYISEQVEKEKTINED